MLAHPLHYVWQSTLALTPNMVSKTKVLYIRTIPRLSHNFIQKSLRFPYEMRSVTLYSISTFSLLAVMFHRVIPQFL